MAQALKILYGVRSQNTGSFEERQWVGVNPRFSRGSRMFYFLIWVLVPWMCSACKSYDLYPKDACTFPCYPFYIHVHITCVHMYMYINFTFFINHFFNVPVHSNIKNVRRTDNGKVLWVFRSADDGEPCFVMHHWILPVSQMWWLACTTSFLQFYLPYW